MVQAPIPLIDLKAQFTSIRDEVMAAIGEVMDSQRFILGAQVEAFEQEVTSALGVQAAVGCASGSDALMLALWAAGVGAGDEVVTTPFTFVATAGAIARLGAIPVFVDIDPRTLTIDPAACAEAITERTRALLPVHLFGLPADVEKLTELAQHRGIALIEDSAQAIGARYRGRAVGGFGKAACFSFFPSKNLGGAGDGGMVTTNDPALADTLRILRDHGSRRRYYYETLGVNSRLDELQAAVLRVKLKRLARWNEARRQIAARYGELLAQAGLEQAVCPPACPPDREHVYHQFTVRVKQRDQLRDFLRSNGIACEIYYPMPLHLQPAFAYLGYREAAFPHAESASREVLSLPIYPELSDEQQRRIVQTIARFFTL